VIAVSRHSFSRTIELLKSTISDRGNTIFAVIDQAAAAARAGLSLRPTTLIIFGNPKGGTALMEAFPLVALELPLKLLVWEENDTVNVAYVAGSQIVARCGITGMESRIQAMDDALAAAVKAVA
jgi:uncharacterized protein (DUF302 family)